MKWEAQQDLAQTREDLLCKQQGGLGTAHGAPLLVRMAMNGGQETLELRDTFPGLQMHVHKDTYTEVCFFFFQRVLVSVEHILDTLLHGTSSEVLTESFFIHRP